MLKMPSLAQWYQTPLGQSVAKAEQSLLTANLQNLFGYHLLLLGAGNTDWLEASRIQHRILIPIETQAGIDSFSANTYSSVRASVRHIPIATDAVDTVILQHALDFSSDPHQVLREAARVLVPEGRILICGFNSLSQWGLTRFLNPRRKSIPWNGQFQRTSRLKDWLSLLGFELEVQQQTFYRPPLQNAKLLDKLNFMERVGPKLYPFAGAVYLLVAKKKVSRLTPIKPRWRSRRKTVSGWADTASRNID